MKVLLVTFSDNADHQDTVFGLYEKLQSHVDTYLLAIKTPKVPLGNGAELYVSKSNPMRAGI